MYELGIAIAFLVWLCGAINLIVSLNSKLEKNLNKIGRRQSWLTLQPTAMEPSDVNRPLWRSALKFVLIYGTALPFTLLSWLYVLAVVGPVVYRWHRDRGAPDAVREMRWKMRNLDMSTDDVIKCMLDAAGAADQFEASRQEVSNTLDMLHGRPVAR